MLATMNREMTKDELVAHLSSSAHFGKPIDGRQWTRQSLSEAHRITHLGLGNRANHRHGSKKPAP